MKLLVGTRKGLFTIERAGAGFRIGKPAFLGAPVTAVLPAGDEVYAAVGHGHFGAKLSRSRDGGQSWEEIAAPRFPEKPAEVDDRDPMGRHVPWSLQQIWVLERSGDALFCGTIPGGLFRSSDRGASWELVRPLWDRPERRKWFGGGYDAPGIHSVLADPRDPRHLLVGVSCGGVWVTEDAGASWEVRTHGMWAGYLPPELREDPSSQDPHRVARCASAPDVLWVQHHNGVFRSTDCARSWTELHVPPSSFGFAVAAHPRDPQTAWFAPAVKDDLRVPVDGRLVVSCTRDGGKTFQVLSEGLPQENAYHLVYRHGLEVDATGEVLAMGTTTGALFLSDSAGQSWRAVSRDLPPIHCVRFA
jgi:photosystem II stability/assembly factor-like uncharacterized protein